MDDGRWHPLSHGALKRRLHVREAGRTKTCLSLSDSCTANLHWARQKRSGMAMRCLPWESGEVTEEEEFDQVAAGKDRRHRGLVRAEVLGRPMN